MLILIKLLLIRIPASSFLEDKSNCTPICKDLESLSNISSRWFGLNEKKAISEPDIIPEIISNTIIANRMNTASIVRPVKTDVRGGKFDKSISPGSGSSIN